MLSRSSNLKIIAYILMILVAVGAVVFACVLRFVSNTALYDTNFDLFHNKLSDQERSGIFHTTAQLMAFQIALLVITNLLWATGVGIVMWRARKRYNQPLEWTGPAERSS